MKNKAAFILMGSMFINTVAMAAQTLTCEIGFFNMEPAGYLSPSEQTLTLSAKIATRNDFDLKSCGSITQGQLQISLCALNTDAQGVVKAELLLTDLKNQELVNEAYTVFGTSKKAGQDMIALSGHDAVSPLLIQRLGNAGIEIQTKFEGDSLMLDEANKKAAQQGLIQKSEVAVVQLLKCNSN